MIDLEEGEPNPYEMDWDIRREGRRWPDETCHARYDRSPEKIELIEGRVFCTDNERLAMVALLLENLGVDAVVRLGDPAVWREAVASLGER